MPSPDQVEMEMWYGLTGIRPRVDDEAIPAKRNPGFTGKVACPQDHTTQGLRVFRLNVICRWNMLAGNDQDMHRGNGMGILKSQQFIILVDHPGGQLTRRDPAKWAGYGTHKGI